jgi:protoporphyrinogen IX oxidase
MLILTFKALHLIFIITWFAGLFYIVRLFIYHTEAHEQRSENPERSRYLIEQYHIMERRLWYGITWPSAILTALFGFSQIHPFFPLHQHPWLAVKLFLVLLLYLYHLSCGRLLKQLQNAVYRWSSFQLRIWNEVATLFVVGIVFLAILKSVLALGQALLGLALLMASLSLGIWVYRRKREGV